MCACTCAKRLKLLMVFMSNVHVCTISWLNRCPTSVFVTLWSTYDRLYSLCERPTRCMDSTISCHFFVHWRTKNHVQHIPRIDYGSLQLVTTNLDILVFHSGAAGPKCANIVTFHWWRGPCILLVIIYWMWYNIDVDIGRNLMQICKGHKGETFTVCFLFPQHLKKL